VKINWIANRDVREIKNKSLKELKTTTMMTKTKIKTIAIWAKNILLDKCSKNLITKTLISRRTKRNEHIKINVCEMHSNTKT
jgi:hypothetical protein